MAEKQIVVFVNFPDIDNYALLLAVHRLYPTATIKIVLIGRPVKFEATVSDETWDYVAEHSEIVQRLNAVRVVNFLKQFGIHRSADIYDGGIAERTPIPHHLHIRDYAEFGDIDGIASVTNDILQPLTNLIVEMLEGKWTILVGGPMTGLHKILNRLPPVQNNIEAVYAMCGSWGTSQMMDVGGGDRSGKNFNVTCDPVAAHAVLSGLTCPVTLFPTEITRISEIGFSTANDLRMFLNSKLIGQEGIEYFCNLYDIWFEKVLQPLQGEIYIYDLAAAFGSVTTLCASMYEVVPVQINNVPHLVHEAENHGRIDMEKLTDESESNRFAAKGFKQGGEQLYRQALLEIF